MKSILEAATAIEQQIIQDRRNLHREPEIGLKTAKTAEYILKRLQEMGIDAKHCGGKVDEKLRENFVFAGFPDMDEATGVVATVGKGEPCILLRADMDALPMPEKSGLDFASQVPGLAHSCGHDSHAAMLLGAAEILKEREAELKGTVKFIFQPGEEVGCGSRLMIEDGMMENPHVDAAFAMHVMPQTDVGTVEYVPGIMSAAMDTYMVKIQGKGGHSSMPHLAIDPLMIANQLYTTLNLFSSREIDPRETVALTVGQCGGGTAANVIPDTAEIMVGTRTFNRDVRNHILKRIPEIVDYTVKMWRGKYEIAEFHTPSTFTDEKICEELKPTIGKIVGMDNIKAVVPMAGTEDFGYYTEKVPSMMIWLGAGNKDMPQVHDPAMVLDERVFATGAAIYAQVAVDWLEKNKKL